MPVCMSMRQCVMVWTELTSAPKLSYAQVYSCVCVCVCVDAYLFA